MTVPPNSSVAFPVGTIIEVVRLGTGSVTLLARVGGHAQHGLVPDLPGAVLGAHATQTRLGHLARSRGRALMHVRPYVRARADKRPDVTCGASGVYRLLGELQDDLGQLLSGDIWLGMWAGDADTGVPGTGPNSCGCRATRASGSPWGAHAGHQRQQLHHRRRLGLLHARLLTVAQHLPGSGRCSQRPTPPRRPVPR